MASRIYLPGEKREHAHTIEDDHLPDRVTREHLWYLFEQLVADHIYDSKHFLKDFADRRATMHIFGESLLDTVKNTVCYDEHDMFDLRILATLVAEVDKPLFRDVAIQVSERFVNNADKPKSPLTLMQFKVLLAYRLSQVGF